MLNDQDKEDMSMEDILESIKRYVSSDGTEDQGGPSPSLGKKETVIELTSEQLVTPDIEEPDEVISVSSDIQVDSEIYRDPGTISQETAKMEKEKISFNKPFEKLTDALRSYGKQQKTVQVSVRSPVDQFFIEIATPIIETWVKKNMQKIVEGIVEKEIEKIKSGG